MVNVQPLLEAFLYMSLEICLLIHEAVLLWYKSYASSLGTTVGFPNRETSDKHNFAAHAKP